MMQALTVTLLLVPLLGCVPQGQAPAPSIPAGSFDVRPYEVRLGESVVWLSGAGVTPEFMAASGAQPMIGRLFTPEEFQPSSPLVVVLGHETWVDHFQASPDAIGWTIQLGERPAVVVGVLSADTNLPAGVRLLVPDERQAAAVRALEAQQAELVAALAARDAERVAALFAEDALLHVAGMAPIKGRAAIRQFYAKMFGFLVESTATPEATHISASGDMAYSTGRTSNAFRGADAPVRYAGKYVLVWQKVADEWLVALYAVSSNEPEKR